MFDNPYPNNIRCDFLVSQMNKKKTFKLPLFHSQKMYLMRNEEDIHACTHYSFKRFMSSDYTPDDIIIKNKMKTKISN